MDKLKQIKSFILEWNEKNKNEYYNASSRVWESAELAMQEFASSKIYINLLKLKGFKVEEAAAGMPTAFVAAYGNGRPVIGLNVEYDALPGLSQRAGSTKKKPITAGAPGHGCGHNLLGAAAVKAGIAIKKALDKFALSGTIKLFGCPAEELCIGKPFLGRAGYFNDVDAFLDWHPFCYNRADFDSCCAYFSIKYHFKGKTSHGNSPWHGRSALDAAILQGHAVEMLREHIYPGCPPDAANSINYTFSDTGPEFPSVVPDRATAWYIGRFVTTEEAENAMKRVTNCAKGAALATETRLKVEIITATHHKIPSRTLAEVLHKNFQEIGPPQFTNEEQEIAGKIQRQMGVPETGLATKIAPFGGGYTGVCDTSEYSWNAPYATAWIAMAPQNSGWHNWGVASCSESSIGKKSMDVASKLLSSTAAELFIKQDLVDKAIKEFKERLNGATYKCLLPENYLPPVTLNRDIMSKYR